MGLLFGRSVPPSPSSMRTLINLITKKSFLSFIHLLLTLVDNVFLPSQVGTAPLHTPFRLEPSPPQILLTLPLNAYP